MVAIVADRVSVRLGGRAVVREVSAAFDPRTLVGILGPNGAGKSSFVRALLGLVAHDGRVTVNGALPSRAEMARHVAYLPQGQTLHWPMSVERLVALGRLPHLAPFSRLADADRAAITRAMARADVTALAARTATDLSGGERARVFLARALAVEASALVADEPLASLDPAHQIETMELLRAEADQGSLVVAVLHDLTLAARFCDRVLVLSHGALIADGAPLDILTSDLLADVYGITAHISPPLLVPMDRLASRPG